ncbi:MAG: hypothetical protein EBZ67_01070 [Chitinophagia bacterium]|nr:hypothetical protein [Chitinophagia bacterium]
MKRTCILLLSVLLSGMAMAQQKSRSGTVSDEGGKPLAGATVTVKGTRTSTLTGEDGKFTINTENGATLEVSYAGYTTGTVKVSGEGSLSVRLSPAAGEISEVVVTGTRGLPRSKLESTAPVDVFDLKSLVTQLPQTNITDMLNNIAPSFNSTPTTSTRPQCVAWDRTRPLCWSTASVATRRRW